MPRRPRARAGQSRGGAGAARCRNRSAGGPDRGQSPEAVALGKRLFYEQLELSIEAAYERASDVMACNAGTEDARRGIARFTKRTV